VLPLLLLLVLHREVVAHHNKITVILSVLKGYTKDVSEGVQTGSSLALRVIQLQLCCTVEEFEEVHSLDDAADGFLLKRLVSFKVTHVRAAEHTFDQEFVVGLHAIRKDITQLFLKAGKRGSIYDGESPEAEILQGTHTISNWVI